MSFWRVRNMYMRDGTAGSHVKREAMTRSVSVLLAIVVVVSFAGCVQKKELPPEVMRHVERTPEQQRVEAWQALMVSARNVSEREKLESINAFFNTLEFVDDKENWGTEDYWATPREMLMRNGGDCEDFATAKYLTLRSLDVPDENMRLVYVKSLRLNQPHMVLSYSHERFTDDPLILDNLTDRILPASQRADLIPVYSFNGQGLWITRKQGSYRLGGAKRLKPWRDLLFRFNQDASAASPSN